MSSHLTARPSRPMPLAEARARRELREASQALLGLCEGTLSLAYYDIGGDWCYYAMARCVRCGAAFALRYRHGAGYDGWAAHETCAQTRSGRSADGDPSIWGRMEIPGPPRQGSQPERAFGVVRA